jgi:hypothetical protein
VSRPQDWSPLADTNPVPGDPAEVAALGWRLRNTADGIDQEVLYLRSLCTNEYWDSEAGSAFRTRVESSAAKLHRAHARYSAAADAVGWGVTGPGYAAALNEAQAQSAKALSRAQGAWADMRRQLATVTAHSTNPWGLGNIPANLSAPPLDGAANPLDMIAQPGDTSQVSAAKQRYNASAGDLKMAIDWLAQAVQDRNQAAAHASNKILAVIGSDGLQDPTGLAALWDDLGHLADDAGHYIDQHWAQWVADLANVCGWIATALGILAMIFAFIPGLQPLAAALEGLALTFTEIAAICHLVLLFTHHGGLKDVILDMVAIASFGIGGSILKGTEGFVEEAGGLSRTGFLAAADRLEGMLARVGEEGIGAVRNAPAEAARAAEGAIKQAFTETGNEAPGVLSRLASKEVWQQAWHPIASFKNAGMEWGLADFEKVFAGGKLPVLRQALGKALTFSSPEIAEQAEKLGKVPELGLISRVTGFNFAGTVVRYGHLYTGVTATAVVSDIGDKLNTTYGWVEQEIKGLNW